MNGEALIYKLNRDQISKILSSFAWAKNFLEKKFPIYKFPGQRITPDIICLDSSLKQISQVRVALALDQDMKMATQNLSQLETDLFKYRSELIIETEKKLKLKDQLISSIFNELLNKISKTEFELIKAKTKFIVKLNNLEARLINPIILGEYIINFETNNR